MVQNLLSLRLLHKKQLKIEGAINLPFVLYECEDWFFLLREDHRLTLSLIGNWEL